jgi:hypothetical protein
MQILIAPCAILAPASRDATIEFAASSISANASGSLDMLINAPEKSFYHEISH